MLDVDQPAAPAPAGAPIPPELARRLGALLFVAVFLLDVFGNPELLAAVSKLCGL